MSATLTGEQVAEALRVAGYVIDKMRCAVPDGQGTGKRVVGPFAAEHGPMVEAMMAAIAPYVAPLTTEVADHWSAPRSNRVIKAEWGGEEATKGRSDEATEG